MRGAERALMLAVMYEAPTVWAMLAETDGAVAAPLAGITLATVAAVLVMVGLWWPGPWAVNFLEHLTGIGLWRIHRARLPQKGAELASLDGATHLALLEGATLRRSLLPPAPSAFPLTPWI